jgi:hypothetical protein
MRSVVLTASVSPRTIIPPAEAETGFTGVPRAVTVELFVMFASTPNNLFYEIPQQLAFPAMLYSAPNSTKPRSGAVPGCHAKWV